MEFINIYNQKTSKDNDASFIFHHLKFINRELFDKLNAQDILVGTSTFEYFITNLKRVAIEKYQFYTLPEYFIELERNSSTPFIQFQCIKEDDIPALHRLVLEYYRELLLRANPNQSEFKKFLFLNGAFHSKHIKPQAFLNWVSEYGNTVLAYRSNEIFDTFESALETLDKIRNTPEKFLLKGIEIYSNFANHLLNIGHTGRALRYFHRILQFIKELSILPASQIEDPKIEKELIDWNIITHSSIADIYQYQSDNSKYLEYKNREFKILNENNYNISSYFYEDHIRNYRYKLAENIVLSDIKRGLENKTQEFENSHNVFKLAKIYQDLGRNAASINLINSLLEVENESLISDYDCAIFKHTLANAYFNKELYNDAKKAIDKAIELYKNINSQNPYLGMAYIVQAKTHIQLNLLEKVPEIIASGLKLLFQRYTANTIAIFNAYLVIGEYQVKTNAKEKAYTLYNDMLQNAQKVLGNYIPLTSYCIRTNNRFECSG